MGDGVHTASTNPSSTGTGTGTGTDGTVATLWSADAITHRGARSGRVKRHTHVRGARARQLCDGIRRQEVAPTAW